MAIDVGDPAPDFTLKTQDEKEWKLSSPAGKNRGPDAGTRSTGVRLERRIARSPEQKTSDPRRAEHDRRRDLAGLDLVAQGLEAVEGASTRPARRPDARSHEEIRVKHATAGFISHRATSSSTRWQGRFVQVQENTKEERNWNELQTELKKLG